MPGSSGVSLNEQMLRRSAEISFRHRTFGSGRATLLVLVQKMVLTIAVLPGDARPVPPAVSPAFLRLGINLALVAPIPAPGEGISYQAALVPADMRVGLVQRPRAEPTRYQPGFSLCRSRSPYRLISGASG